MPFGTHTKYMRIDRGAEEIGRNFTIDVGIAADERAALETQALYKLPIVHIVYNNNAWRRSPGRLRSGLRIDSMMCN